MKHKDKIIQLHKEGKSYREIQGILGCSKGTIAYHLGEGQKEKTRERQRDRRGQVKKLIQQIKQDAVCADCKENYPFWMMDFDHLGDKSFTISHASNHTQDLEIIKKEIEKCDVVCANCHRNRTYLRAFNGGSNSMDVSQFYK